MSRPHASLGRGPFRADQIREKDPYEISDGHAILCLPTGARGSRATVGAAEMLDTDPAVESAGVDTGFAPVPDMLRAPDIAVGSIPDAPGWVRGVPPLAVEFADTGQDEEELHKKIGELLGAGTRYIWVVRMSGPRRVEVYEPDGAVRTFTSGDELRAPGVLRNPVPVQALFDREAAQEVTLRNLLQRHGYESLDAVREEGHAVGHAEAVLAVIAARGLHIDEAARARISSCRDLAQLERWLARAAVVVDAALVFADPTF